MDPKYYGLVELAFTTTIVFSLGFWQLWSLRRDRRRSQERDETTPPDA